jgi:Reverse transcriptase (RNA-dependent DNA polymerase)
MSNLVCRLKKLIYVLRQSPKVWYDKLNYFLISYNFKVSNANSSLFIKHNCNGITIVLVYVDDLIITENNQMKIELIKRNLK